jgi:cytochrome c-type biogenesis protein CcmH/NrfG
MKSESVAFALAGVLFGLLAGWIIGSQQAALRQPAQSPAPATASSTPAQPPPMDEAQVSAARAEADRDPSNAGPRARLGNLYFDAERYNDAIVWYTEALKLEPANPDVSTDLGISYYYTDQADRALEQFERSLKIDPRHTKTMLNIGVVKAFGKQDLPGAEEAWKKVVEIAPDSQEGQQARRALEALRSAHPPTGATAKPGS